LNTLRLYHDIPHRTMAWSFAFTNGGEAIGDFIEGGE
jgi:hypothetical protein